MPIRLQPACQPRRSVFDSSVRDTVYNIDDLDQIQPERFFTENYVTQGMHQLLTTAFERLEGRNHNASGAFLLSQSMGGGKTHNLIALGLLARYPEFRQPVMCSFYNPGDLGPVRVLTFSGRKTNTPFGIWGEIAQQLGRREVFKDFYSPLLPPGDHEWIELLSGNPVLILLDELPPYFEAAQAREVGTTTLAGLTTTALANLLVAVTSDKLPNACVVLTDLRAAAYGAGSASVSDALRNLELEANRSVVRIDPVRLTSDELYHILRTRLFERLPDPAEVEAVADAFAQTLDDARRMDLTTASAHTLRTEIRNAYPFHPAIRDLFARFKENPGFQQTRALIRIMRIVVSDLWQSGTAKQRHLISAHDLDFHRPAIMSEIRQINPTLENAIAHDIASDAGTAVAEQIDAQTSTDAQDAAKLIFLSSLSQAVSPTLGLTRSDLIHYLAAPGRDLTHLRAALDQLQAQAWYLHTTAQGALFFKNVENLNAKQEAVVRGMLNEARENELRQRLKDIYDPTTGGGYQLIEALPALDQLQIVADRVTLVIYRPTPTAPQEIDEFFKNQTYKNRALFLSSEPSAYQRVLDRSAYLRAINLILKDLKEQGLKEGDPQVMDADTIKSRDESAFYLACREAFLQLQYPSRRGLTALTLEHQYVSNRWNGEEQILKALTEAFKYTTETAAEKFRTAVENRLWPPEVKEVAWSQIRQRAATDPAWDWYHPVALDSLRDTLVQRGVWRDVGGGFIQRGPFPKPPASVSVRLLSRDERTGEAALHIQPLNADVVYISDSGPATTASPRLDKFEFKTSAVALSFLAIDTTGGFDIGDPVDWYNTIEVKVRTFHQSDRLMCELHALPSGTIRYTLDGSAPSVSGQPYTEPFPVPRGVRLILAQATAAGVSSPVLSIEVPADGAAGPRLDLRKPATWKRRHSLDSPSATYNFLELAEQHRTTLGGVALTVETKNGASYAELTTDPNTYQTAAGIRNNIDLLVTIIPGGSPRLVVKSARFETAQDLQDLVAALKTTLQEGEVEQHS